MSKRTSKVSRLEQPIMQLLKEQKKITLPDQQTQLTPSLDATIDRVVEYNSGEGRSQGRMMFAQIVDTNVPELMIEDDKPFSIGPGTETLATVKAKAKMGEGKVWAFTNNPQVTFSLEEGWRADSHLLFGEIIANAVSHIPADHRNLPLELICDKKKLNESGVQWVRIRLILGWFVTPHKGFGSWLEVLVNFKNGKILSSGSNRDLQFGEYERTTELQVEQTYNEVEYDYEYELER